LTLSEKNRIYSKIILFPFLALTHKWEIRVKNAEVRSELMSFSRTPHVLYMGVSMFCVIAILGYDNKAGQRHCFARKVLIIPYYVIKL